MAIHAAAQMESRTSGPGWVCRFHRWRPAPSPSRLPRVPAALPLPSSSALRRHVLIQRSTPIRRSTSSVRVMRPPPPAMSSAPRSHAPRRKAAQTRSTLAVSVSVMTMVAITPHTRPELGRMKENDRQGTKTQPNLYAHHELRGLKPVLHGAKDRRETDDHRYTMRTHNEATSRPPREATTP